MRRWPIYLCFLCSGAAGLIDEVVWIRKASLVFGSTTFAVSTVLAVFFGGLALGSELAGRFMDRVRRPLRTYARLELLLAALALLSLPAFGWLDAPYGALYRALGGGEGAGDPVLLLLSRLLLTALVLLPPATAMGATLPLFVRRFVSGDADLSARVGFLYGLNTLGAAAGTLAAGFVLLPALGMQGSIAVAAALNVVAGGLALGLARGEDAAPAPVGPAAATAAPLGGRAWVVASLFLLTGLAALAAEVVWTRFLSLLVRNSVTTYTLALAVVLVGIVIGSWLAARLWDRRLPLAAVFAGLQAGAGLILLGVTHLPPSFWQGLGEGVAPFALLMLPPAVLSGASFPLAVKLASRDGGDAARTVGRLAALNTVGGILGSLAAGFWLLPRLGMAVSLQAVTGLSVLAAVLALLLLDRPTGGAARLRRLAVAALAAATWALLPRMLPASLPDDYLRGSGSLLAVREGYGATLSVVRREGDRVLLIDRLWQGRDRKNHQIMAAHVPALLHPSPRRVLVIGLGVGQTAGRFLLHDPERVDCVDIEPTLFPFVRENFASAWMDDPRVHAIPDDGRTYTAHTDRTYDLISIEVGQVFRPGVDAFYTRRFYRDARARLAPGGLAAQFVPLPFLDETMLRRITATFLEAFPQAVLWYNGNELILIGAADGPVTPDPQRLAAVTRDPRLRADLAWTHWGGRGEHLNDPANLLAGLLCDTDGLRRLAADAAPLVDDRPDLAYASRTMRTAATPELALTDLLEGLLAPLPEILAPDDLARARDLRRGNLADLRATAVLRDVRARMAAAGFQSTLAGAQRALALHPENRHAQRMLGDVLNLAGRFQDAEPWFRRVLERAPDDPEARRGLALCLSRTGRLEEAMTVLRRLLADSPDDAVAHNYLGACLADRGRLPEAAEHFRRAAALDPADRGIQDNLERVERDLRRYQGR